MSILGRLFGNDDVIKKASQGIYNGVDAAWFTKEEKANHFKKLLKLYEPFRIAQRYLALIICIPYSAIWVLCAILFMFAAVSNPCGVEDICASRHYMEIARELAQFNHQNLSQQSFIILGFYFGGGAIEGIVRARGGSDK